jgi:hypothetical protein
MLSMSGGQQMPAGSSQSVLLLLPQVDFVGREVTADHLTQLSKIVGLKDPGKGRSLFASAASMPFVSSASMKPTAAQTK